MNVDILCSKFRICKNFFFIRVFVI